MSYVSDNVNVRVFVIDVSRQMSREISVAGKILRSNRPRLASLRIVAGRSIDLPTVASFSRITFLLSAICGVITSPILLGSLAYLMTISLIERRALQFFFLSRIILVPSVISFLL